MKHAWDGIGPKKDCLIQIEVGRNDFYWVQAKFRVNKWAIGQPWEYRLGFPTHDSVIYNDGGFCFDPQGNLDDSEEGPTGLTIYSIVAWAELPTSFSEDVDELAKVSK